MDERLSVLGNTEKIEPSSADTIDWERPIMTNSDLAKVHFSEMRQFITERIISPLSKLYEELENRGLLEEYMRYANQKEEIYTYLQHTINSINDESLISNLSWDDRQKLSELRRLSRFNYEEATELDSLLFRNPSLAEQVDYEPNDFYDKYVRKLKSRTQEIWDWTFNMEDMFREAEDPRGFAMIHSVHTPYLLTHFKQLDVDDFIETCKNTYNVVGFEDHLAAVDKLIEDTPEGETIYLYISERKRQDQDYDKTTGGEIFKTSDDFMANLLKVRCEKKGRQIITIRGLQGVREHFLNGQITVPEAELQSSLESKRICVLDDVAVTATQKIGLEDELRDLIKMRSSSRSLDIKFHYYFAAMAKIAVDRFSHKRSNFNYIRYIPSVKEQIPEPNLTLLRLVWQLWGKFPKLMHLPFENPMENKDIEESISKPILVTPFKVPDFVSQSPFWTESLLSQSYLFPLASDKNSSPSAYVDPEALLELVDSET